MTKNRHQKTQLHVTCHFECTTSYTRSNRWYGKASLYHVSTPQVSSLTALLAVMAHHDHQVCPIWLRWLLRLPHLCHIPTLSQFYRPIVWENFLTRHRTAYKITSSSFCLTLVWWWKITYAIYEYRKAFSRFDPILLLSIQQCTGNIPILLNRACTGLQQLRTMTWIQFHQTFSPSRKPMLTTGIRVLQIMQNVRNQWT